MNLFLKYLSVAAIYLICGCESDILFKESQPSGIESQTELPEKFIGTYIMDLEKISEMKDEPIPKNIPAETKRPFLIITAETIFFLEYRYDDLHENFVDGVSYELRNNYLFRDNKQISLEPVEKMVTRILIQHALILFQ